MAEDDQADCSTDKDAVDTTADFLRVFQGKTEFDSWEEFTTLFEKFQKETGSVFKAKHSMGVEYANMYRVKDQIPDKFVYQTVRMVCQHYGDPVKRENSTRKMKKYVGLGCKAILLLTYKGGSLNIVRCNLEHRNHKLSRSKVVSTRNIRSFTYTDDLDFLMAKVVLEHNPFSAWNSEKEWLSLVEDLQSRDPRMKTVTPRVVKKRIRFLTDRYMANSNGKPPLPDDNMGIILCELAKAKHDAMDNAPKLSVKKSLGRPRKVAREETNDQEEAEIEDSHLDFDDSPDFVPDSSSIVKMEVTRTSTPVVPVPTVPVPATPAPLVGSSGKDISAFLRYMERKDEHDRKFRQVEFDLLREQLELRKKELEFQREKFEFDRLERQAHLDLLKMQLDVISGPKRQLIAEKVGNAITEYTIVLNNDHPSVSQ